jgi:hypothetical protein
MFVSKSVVFGAIVFVAAACSDYKVQHSSDAAGANPEEESAGGVISASVGDSPDVDTSDAGIDASQGSPDGIQLPNDTGVADAGSEDTGWDYGTDADNYCRKALRNGSLLDQEQVEGSHKITFCHSMSDGHWAVVSTDYSSCSAHLDHAYDVFPSTGCVEP